LSLLGTLLWNLSGSGVAVAQPLGWFNPCNFYNTQQIGTVTVVGRLPNAPYVVAIPGNNPETLAQVRQCVPDALVLQIRRGKYIQVGAFRDRAQAESLNRAMQDWGLDSRVIYQR